MPVETSQAVQWALQQVDPDGMPVTVENRHWLVHFVREYFNAHSIEYEMFSFDDLVPYLPQ